LKLQCDQALSNVAFNFNLRRYAEVNFAPPGAFGVNGSGSGPQVVVSASADGSLRAW